MISIPEIAILKHLLAVDNYNKYIRYIDISKEYRELSILYHTLEALHLKFPEVDKSVDELETYAAVCYPNLGKSERDAIGDLCEQIRTTQISDSVANELLATIRTRAGARALALAAFEVSEGRRESSALKEIYETVSEQSDLEQEQLSESKNFVTDRLDVLHEHTVKSGGLYWPLRCLNLSLGPLRRGDFGFAFSRPETGKTTFLSHAVTHMAFQAADQGLGPICWFNNEEQGEKVRVRTFQSTLGYTTDTLFRDIEGNQKKYDDLTKGLIRIYDDASIHRRDVESIVEQLAPSLIIFDQIDKIKGFDADRPDLVYGRIYQWARELSKSYCPCIGVCQADGTGEGVKWLTMGHVAEAKTSKQAEADWILGIGRSNEGGTEDVRYFNISKNKLMGDAKSDPELRHGRFDVYIRPQVARYEDLLED